MASLDILFLNPLNLENEIRKIEHEKIFCGPSKNLENISWPINIRLKCFMISKKTLHSPLSYVLNEWSVRYMKGIY